MKNTGITYTSAERSPVILPEMAELLPPLSAEQLDALEADLIKNGCYAAMREALPDMRTTSSLRAVTKFLRERKPESYFEVCA